MDRILLELPLYINLHEYFKLYPQLGKNEELLTYLITSIKMLADIAESEPQAAYSAYISGIQHRWKFVQRTVPHISEAMEPLEHEIRQKLLPKMLGREISDLERDVLSLPIRLLTMLLKDYALKLLHQPCSVIFLQAD